MIKILEVIDYILRLLGIKITHLIHYKQMSQSELAR